MKKKTKPIDAVIVNDDIANVNKARIEKDILKFLRDDKGLGVNVTTLSESGANVTRWFDTDSLTWNFVSSGSLKKGLPYGRVIECHGETTTGKSLLGAQIAAQAVKQGALTFFFDPEYGMDTKFIRSVGGDENKIITFTELGTIEKFNKAVLKTIEYLALKNKDPQVPVVMILDSLAMLSSEQELKSPDKNDMTKAKKIRQFFRTYMDECVRHGILLFVVNQVYKNIGVMFGPDTSPTGGMGLPYAASQRYALRTPKYEKEGEKSQGDVEGTRVKMKTLKNRVSVPFRSVYIRFTYGEGLDRYGGLFELMGDGDGGNVTALNLLQKEGNRWIWPGVIDEKFWAKDFVEVFKAKEEEYIEALEAVIEEKTKRKEIPAEALSSDEEALLSVGKDESEESLISRME